MFLARKKGCKVLVHCKMGVSRSASTVIAYAMKNYRWSLEKALNFVKVWPLIVVSGALADRFTGTAADCQAERRVPAAADGLRGHSSRKVNQVNRISISSN